MYQFKEESIQKSKRNSLANTVFYHNKLRKWARHARDEVHRLEDEYKTLDVFLFHPLEPFKIHWDLAVMLILMYVSMDIPFRICFEVNLPLFCPYEIWDLCIDIFFMIDIIFTFNTGFLQDGAYITNRRHIARNYFSGWFWLDLITSFPLQQTINPFMTSSTSTHLPRLLKILRLLRLMKLLRVLKLFKAMSSWENTDKTTSASVIKRLVKFMVTVLVIAHIAACMWVGIAVFYSSKHGESFETIDWHPQCWIVRNRNYYGHDRNFLYTQALYWAYTTLTTVGYGDIFAQLPLELAWAMSIQICGTSTFGYIIGNVASIITSEDETAVIIRKKIESVSAYLRCRQFPDNIAEKIRRHYEFSWKRSKVYDEEQILLELPHSIRTEVALFLHADTLQKVPFLQELGEDVFPMLVVKLRPTLVTPKDIVIKEDFYGSEMYFVAAGMLKMFQAAEQMNRNRISLDGSNLNTKKMELHVAQIKKGDYFAEYTLILDYAKHPCSVRALCYCDLFSLTKTDFEEICEQFPDLFGKVIAVGQFRYMKMMKQLQAKRKFAMQAGGRGLQLLGTGGSVDAELLEEPESHNIPPLGFFERWRKIHTLRDLIRAKKQHRENIKERSISRLHKNINKNLSKPTLLSKISEETTPYGQSRRKLIPLQHKSSSRVFVDGGSSKSCSDLEQSIQEDNHRLTAADAIPSQVPAPACEENAPRLGLKNLLRHNGKLVSRVKKWVHLSDNNTQRNSTEGLLPSIPIEVNSANLGRRVSALLERRGSLIHMMGGSQAKRGSIADITGGPEAKRGSIIQMLGGPQAIVQMMAPPQQQHHNRRRKETTSPSVHSFNNDTDDFYMPSHPFLRADMDSRELSLLSVHVLSQLRLWKNRAVMNVALKHMAKKERHFLRQISGRKNGLESLLPKSGVSLSDIVQENSLSKISERSKSDWSDKPKLKSAVDPLPFINTETASRPTGSVSSLASPLPIQTFSPESTLFRRALTETSVQKQPFEQLENIKLWQHNMDERLEKAGQMLDSLHTCSSHSRLRLLHITAVLNEVAKRHGLKTNTDTNNRSVSLAVGPVLTSDASTRSRSVSQSSETNKIAIPSRRESLSQFTQLQSQGSDESVVFL